MLNEFNTRHGAQTYIYRRSAHHARSFLILKREDENFKPVGDYMVLDTGEHPALSEKKLINLVTLMNGGDQLIDLGQETKSRLLYHIVSHDGPPSHKKIIFYTLGEQGVSVENALLSLHEEDADVSH